MPFAAWTVRAIVLILAAGTARAAPLTSNTALPVATGEFVFRAQIIFDRSGEDPSGADRDREALVFVSALGYGVNRDLALFAILPYADKSLELTDGTQRLGRSAGGIGDVSLFARYTILRRDWPQRTFRIAPFGGVELPTGDDDATDGIGLLPPAVQPGSGSIDPFAGVIATYQTLDFQIDAQAAYRANTKANAFEFGDVARFDLSLQVRLWPRAFSGGVPGFLYGVLETNLIHQARHEAAGIANPNSGGITLFVVPGVQYVTKRWILEAGVQLPIIQDLNGTALRKDFIMRAGFRVNF